MLKNIAFCVLTILALNAQSQGIHVNRVFQDAIGSPVFNPILNPFGVQWSKSITNGGGELITVGHTTVSGQGENIYLIKYDAVGNLVFQVNYNTSSTNNDYGISLAEDPSGNIFVCGTTDNGGSTNYDIVILKYNSGGTLLNSTTFAGSAGKNDIGTAIKISSSGIVYVAASNENNTSGYDYLLLKYSNSLSLQWSNTYDYAGLTEVPLGLEISGSDVLITGSSASNSTSWDYCTARFDASSGNYISDTRNSISGIGIDQPLAMCKDASGNIYITGKALNGSANYDIYTVKITPGFTVAWSQVFDGYALDDVGNTIAVDAGGDVIVGGFSTKTSTNKEAVCIKYNGSSGTQTWIHTQESEDNSGDAFFKTICMNNSTGNIYYVGGEKGNSGLKQVIVGRINANGTKVWEKKIQDSGDDILPSDIEYGTDGVYAISVLDSATDSYLTTKYSELELDTTRTYSGGQPRWKTRELIVSFLPSAINATVINNQVGTKISEFGNLSDFLTSASYSAVNSALSSLCRGDCDIQAVKIYTGLKTTDTVAVSRLGENVPIPSFWSTLLIQLPSGISIQQAGNALITLPNIVSFAHPNYVVAQILSPPNDSLYNSQHTIHQVGSSPNAHINVEEAWTVAQDCGSKHVKGGLFDTGIQWAHKDFGYTGSATSGKIQGWFFPAQNAPFNCDIRSAPIPDGIGHGTQMAGIIGAQRNNTSGVAGIAGGDGTTNNPGVSLYSLGIIASNMNYWLDALFATSGGDTTRGYSYRLNFSNHSYLLYPIWWTSGNIDAYRDQVHFANRMQVTYVAARGSDGINNPIYPANFDTSWVISVGGSDTTGSRWYSSSYGSGMDVIAPATGIMRTTHNDGYYFNGSGTSAASAHASGVVALLMSYMNDTTASYKNLAPEDCDFIIQRSATDVGSPGYDSLNGYGMLNAGKALRMVEKPFRVLYHYGTNYRFPYTISKTVYSNSDTVRLIESYKNQETPKVSFPKAKYIVKTFQIDATVNHSNTYPTDSLMYFWPRHSSSHVFDLPNAQKNIDLHERVKITSITGSSANLRGYVYQVWDSVGTNPPLGWWPCDTSFSALYVGTKVPKTLMEYSVLTKNKAVSINELNKESQTVNLFPNPANKQQTLVFEYDKENVCTIELYDLMGRFIKTVYRGRVNIGKTSIMHNIEDLPNSMYIYIIKLDGKTFSKKFIKQ